MAPSATAPAIPVPSSLSASDTKLPTRTQNALLEHLQNTGSIGPLSEVLQDSLARAGWVDRIRALSLELLRNSDCTTFPELMNEILRRAALPADPEPEANGTKKDAQTNGTTSKQFNGLGNDKEKTVNGTTNEKSSQPQSIVLAPGWLGQDGLPDVRVPKSTVAAGVSYLREKIQENIEIVPADDD